MRGLVFMGYTMQETFASRNELEEKLMAAQEGQLPGGEFMHYPDWPVGMDLEPEMVRQQRVN